MAFIDNPEWLISHIRQCFITSDCVCERLIGQDEQWERILRGESGGQGPHDLASESEDGDVTPSSSPQSSSSSPLQSPVDSILPSSFDIHLRHTPNNQPLHRPSQQPLQPPQPPLKNVAWRKKPGEDDYDPETMGHLFEKKKLPEGGEDSKKVSSLSRLLAEMANMPTDPFLEYGQFDGMTQAGIPIKKINIFLTMCKGQDRWTPIPTVVQATAKVSDLIGLICHRYVQAQKTPPLTNDTVEGYSLFIADDDGDVDDDFPPIDSGEPIAKFDFASLALVESEVPPPQDAVPVIITVNIPDRGWHKVQIEDDSLLMKEILKIVLQRRRKKEGRGIEYVLEKQSEPGKAINLDKPLKEMGTTEFWLIRANSVRRTEDESTVEEEEAGLPRPDPLAEMLFDPSLPMPNSRFTVFVVRKLKANVEAYLDIDSDRLAINPVAAGSTKLKPLYIELQFLLGAEVVEEKAKGKALFRLRYQLPDDGHECQLDLKCVSLTAHEIVSRINAVLEARFGVARSWTKLERPAVDRRTEKRRSLLPL